MSVDAPPLVRLVARVFSRVANSKNTRIAGKLRHPSVIGHPTAYSIRSAGVSWWFSGVSQFYLDRPFNFELQHVDVVV